MPPTTKQMVADAFQDLVIAQGVEWVDKRTDAFQKTIGEVLELLKIQDASTYRGKYLSMIPTPVKTIYATPFTPGEPTEDYPLDAQLDSLPHELTHFLDAKSEGLVSYGAQYLARKTGRVHREMRANAAMGEWHKTRYGAELDAKWLAEQMAFYGCLQEVPFAEVEMRSMLITVNAGGVVQGLGGEAMVRWALAKYPELVMINPLEDE